MRKKTLRIIPFLALLVILTIIGSPAMAYGQSSPVADQESQLYRDDFYTAVNRDWLQTAVIPEGETYTSTHMEMRMQTRRQLIDIVNQLLQVQHVPGSKEQQLCDYYLTQMDMESRNKEGVRPILPFLEAYESATTINDLLQAEKLFYSRAGNFNLISHHVSADYVSNDKNVLYIYTLLPLQYESYTDPRIFESYLMYIKTLFMLSGSPAEQAHKDALAVASFERDLALEMKNGKMQKLSFQEFGSLFPQMDVASLFTQAGYDPSTPIYFEYCDEFLHTFSVENLDIMKLFAKKKILVLFESFLSEDFMRVSDTFISELIGSTGGRKLEDRVMHRLQEDAPSLLEQLYVDNHFSKAAKEDVEEMVKQVIAAYKKRLMALNWLSEETKKRAVGKLDAMEFTIGYPDQWSSPLENVEISTYANGGSCIGNFCAIQLAYEKRGIAKAGKPVNRSTWKAYAYETQGCYNFNLNAFSIAAGMLQPPVYDIHAKTEYKLGGIGLLIAHEISHAFDNDGSMYDENGKLANWWTDEDLAKFEAKCNKVVELYDGIEIYPGIVSNGTLTLGENVADLGAMSCLLDVLSQMENPDYKAFFEAFALYFRGLGSSEFYQYAVATDTHSLFRLRVNRLLSNFREFYQTYGITEGDGMFIPPEDRAVVW